jgi:hypothetical protein
MTSMTARFAGINETSGGLPSTRGQWVSSSFRKSAIADRGLLNEDEDSFYPRASGLIQAGK